MAQLPKFRSVVSPPCKERCADVILVDGVVPAFANTWTGLTKKPAHFMLFLTPDAALTGAGSEDQRFWSDYDAGAGIYQVALKKYRDAQHGPAFKAPKSIDRTRGRSGHTTTIVFAS